VSIKEQQKQIASLTAKASEPKMPAYPLEFQEKCSDQARKTFKDLGYKPTDHASYESHYSNNLGKCLIHIHYTMSDLTISGSVSDAYEGKVYAEFMWIPDKTKKYWEVPPRQCEVTLPNQEKRLCHSTEEFDALVKELMEK